MFVYLKNMAVSFFRKQGEKGVANGLTKVLPFRRNRIGLKSDLYPYEWDIRSARKVEMPFLDFRFGHCLFPLAMDMLDSLFSRGYFRKPM